MQTYTDAKTALPTVTPGLGRTADGRLTFNSLDCVDLARRYGTPLYLMSEDTVRANCRRHISSLRRHLGANAVAAYASKALSFRQMYRIMNEEGMYADAVSSGELYTAFSAGFDMSHIVFHGNNKTPADIAYAIKLGTGLIVADSGCELGQISRAAQEAGTVQRVLIRLTPGIDPHTHAKISTGQVDSKFGIPLDEASDAIALAQSLPGVQPDGIHYHIGSQIAEAEPYVAALEHVLPLLTRARDELGFTARLLNMGGGFGIRYVESDRETELDRIFASVGRALDDSCRESGYPRPVVMTEPGRSIVADAGITLYTVGSVKRSGAGTLYVSVDGGMTDNPRYTLYGAEYTALSAIGTGARVTCSIVGRCCESGDILIPHAEISAVEPGDVIAVLNTGAYNYSMASNYNRIPRPPVVMLRGAEPYIAVRRESPEDVSGLDV